MKKFFGSPNTWFALVAIVAAIFGANFPTDEANNIVAGVLAIVASGNILFHYFRDLETRPSFKDILKNPGFWLSLLTALAGFLPWLPVPELQALVKAIIAGDANLILQAGFALLLVIIQIFKKTTAKA